jgi:fructosamine-3-kinase
MDSLTAVSISHGGDNMIVTIDHIDQLYVLQEAIDDFVAKCDREKHWRAVKAAEALAAQLQELSQSSQP